MKYPWRVGELTPTSLRADNTLESPSQCSLSTVTHLNQGTRNYYCAEHKFLFMIFMKERSEENSLKYYLSLICRSSRKITQIIPMWERGNLSLYNLRERRGCMGSSQLGGLTRFPWRSCCCSVAQSYPTLSAIYPKVDMLDPMVILF